MLFFSSGLPFTQGFCHYDLRPTASGGQALRVMVPILIEGMSTEAVIDTGGSYLVCNPEIGRALCLDPSSAIETEALLIRGIRYQGTLHRCGVEIVAEEGQSVSIESTVFVPKDDDSTVWPLPVIMGLQGCLERLRFAIDPYDEVFHFGLDDAPA